MALVIKSICWNTNGNNSLGSINCRKNYDVAIEPDCIVQGNNTELVGVFVPQNIGASMRLSITVFNDGDEIINAIIAAHEISEVPILGDVQFDGLSLEPQQSETLTADINPVHIKRPSFSGRLQKVTSTWEFSYNTPVSTQQINLVNTTQTMYILPNPPIQDYSVATNVWHTDFELYNSNTHNYIWTDLLDICCMACDDYNTRKGHRPSNNAEHIEAFVYALNHCKAFHYDIYTGASNYCTKVASGNTSVKLKKFVRDSKNTYPSNLNCTDCASIIAIEGLACGIPTYTVVMMDNTATGFACNPIVAIGHAAWKVPFDSGFSYHEVTVLMDTCDKDTGIYDACLHLDSGDTPSSTGPAGKTALLPLAYLFAETNISQVQVMPGVPYTAQFYRERLAAHLETCQIVNHAYCILGLNNNLSAQEAVQMSEDSQFLGQVKAQYGLGHNPLPIGRLCDTWQTAPKSMGLYKLGNWTLVEDYERNKCYELQRGDNRFQIQLWFAMDEEEAWTLLLTRLAVISNPNVNRDKLGDISFQIGEKWKLFVANNILVEVFCETNDVTETAAAIVAVFTNHTPHADVPQ